MGNLVLGEGEREWCAASPDPRGPKDFQASCYRALCLSSDGMSKLRAIRKALRHDKPAAKPKETIR